jgi:hypothetical protein
MPKPTSVAAVRYVVAEGQEFNYPADAATVALIAKAGGRSKMTQEQHKKANYKIVKAGDDCSDMPQTALALYLERGWIVALAPISSSEKASSEVTK